jgi:hypothetical protein
MKQREPTLFAPVSNELASMLGTAGRVSPQDLLYQGTGEVVPRHAAGPFETYVALHDAMVDACIAAEANADAIAEHLAPELTEAMKEHHCFSKVKEWHGRPKGFDALVVMADANPVPPFNHVTPDDIASLYNMDSAGDKGAEGEDSGGDNDTVDEQWYICEGTKSQNHLDAMENYRELMTLNQSTQASGQFAVKGNSGLEIQCAHGKRVSLAQALSVWQMREWVSRERGPRFWVGVLPEHRKLPPGHTCTFGTMIVISIFPGIIALGRVHRIDKSGAEFGVKSCKLYPNTPGVLLTMELCWNTGITNDLGTEFVASGLFLPSVKGTDVLAVSPSIALGTKGSNNAIMSVDDFASNGTFLTKDGLQSIRPELEEVVVVMNDNEDDDDNECQGLCCRCSKGWWSDTTGKVVMCSGGCKRLFHPCCAEVDTSCVDWQCMRCSGVDDAICKSCDWEWYCDEKVCTDGTPNPYYTGAMLECSGDNCGLWYHQQCHEPHIEDVYVATQVKRKPGSKGRRGNWSGKPWYCAACKPNAGAGSIKKRKQAPATARVIAEEVPHQEEEHEPPTSRAHEWLCMSCNGVTPIANEICSEPTCRKSYSHFGVDFSIGEVSSHSRTGQRKRTATSHPGQVSWEKQRVGDNMCNREKLHSSMVNPVAKDVVHDRVVHDALVAIVPDDPSEDDKAPEDGLWTCIACNTITHNNFDVCSKHSCQKQKSIFGVSVCSDGLHGKSTRHRKVR